MRQLFAPSADTILRIGFFSFAMFVCVVLLTLYNCNQPHYILEDNLAPSQPVPFSHQHHVNALGIDCRYCHTSVETSSSAGMPPTETCMTCHSQIWTDAPMLEPVRKSYRENVPLNWTRVYNLPDFVYFDHSIHISKGVGCVECHGRIDQMPLTRLAQPLTMKWCLSCHNEPYPNLRPRDQVFEMKDWKSLANNSNWNASDHINVSVDQLKNCSICHR